MANLVRVECIVLDVLWGGGFNGEGGEVGSGDPEVKEVAFMADAAVAFGQLPGGGWIAVGEGVGYRAAVAGAVVGGERAVFSCCRH